MPVWYRRRWQNIARKSGNLEDFVTRWGGRYDHMIVLDADSLIDAPTLQRLVQAMQSGPRAGDTADRSATHRREDFFRPAAAIRRLRLRPGHHARTVAHGPATAAIIGDTTPSFAWPRSRKTAACRKLEGRKPFGGFVLSHDFVEAALMRRGGWKVRMATDCGGSWEESPPSLIDIAIRDRRWAQGNLQHMKIIGAAGLSFISRMHLGVGIMSYLSSPLWLVMLGIGFALAVQSHLIRPEYFNHDFQLFPTWPRFDVELMMALFWFSMVVLLIPKMLGLIARAVARAAFAAAAAASSASPRASCWKSSSRPCTHPILMLIQCRHVFEVFMGRDSGWKPQRRDGGGTSWGDAWHYPSAAHALELRDRRDRVFPLAAAARLGVAGAARIVSRGAAVARQRQRSAWARFLSRLALLRTPEEVDTPALVVAPRGIGARRGAHCRTTDLRFLARNREARLTHINGNLARPADPRGQPDPHAFTAEQKLMDARSLDEALAVADADRARRSRRRCPIAQSARAAAGRRAPHILDLRIPNHHGSTTRNTEISNGAGSRTMCAYPELRRARAAGRRPGRQAFRLRLAQGPGALSRRQRLSSLARMRCRRPWRSSATININRCAFAPITRCGAMRAWRFACSSFTSAAASREPVHLYEIIDGQAREIIYDPAMFEFDKAGIDPADRCAITRASRAFACSS